MQDALLLVAVSGAMALGTYAVGTLPLAFQLSRSSLRKMELWGAGLLLGAALTVVVPEGIANVYKRQLCGPDGDKQLAPHSGIRPKDVIAACLLSGFLLMFISVDQRNDGGGCDTEHVCATEENPSETSALNDAGWQPLDAADAYSGRGGLGGAASGILGLLVHAMADGVAMGTSAQSTDMSLRIVVVLAITVHKAPSSIGLCTLLMARQMQREDIRRAILLFSLTTPLSALLTYTLVFAFIDATGRNADGGLSIDSRSIGAILSFSGGTFLYVAMRAVLELAATTDTAVCVAPWPSESVHPHAHHPLDHDHPIHARTVNAPASSGRVLPVRPRAENRLNTPLCLFLVVLGSVTPRLLQLLVGDEHKH
ncbi:hypothetical protein MSPP1_003687 [Malassezia sp. CBS 17886]|nr:hypothetical protein MSPP1_003687 [Malassezia sp. CBS 17886]